MPAPKGNKFWEQRASHGRDTLFASPELLWEAAVEYFKWCDDNPMIEYDYRGKDATPVEIKKPIPYTMQGLCFYLDCNVFYFNQFEKAIKERKAEGKSKDTDEGFSLVISRIRDFMFNQKLSGAAAGLFNANIIARELGLSDKQTLSNDPENPFEGGNQVVVFQLPENNR